MAYNIGSIVTANSHKYLVIGGGFVEEDNKNVEISYIVPFPMGVIGENSIRVVNTDALSLVREGYKSDLSEKFMQYMDMMKEISERADPETFRAALESNVANMEI